MLKNTEYHPGVFETNNIMLIICILSIWTTGKIRGEEIKITLSRRQTFGRPLKTDNRSDATYTVNFRSVDRKIERPREINIKIFFTVSEIAEQLLHCLFYYASRKKRFPQKTVVRDRKKVDRCILSFCNSIIGC